MTKRPTNFAFDQRPAQLDLTSPVIVLLDPLALDGLSAELQRVSAAPAAQQRRLLKDLQTTLRIGIHELSDFRPGTFELGAGDFESASDGDGGAFDVDSGTVVVIDLPYLGRVAAVLTWDRYDALLQAPVDDDTALNQLVADVGGSCFALIAASADSSFDGDGAFRVRAGAPRPV